MVEVPQDGPVQRAKHRRHFWQLISSLKAAGIGEQPEFGGRQRLGLLANRRLWALKSCPVGLNPEDGDTTWAHGSHLGFKTLGARTKFIPADFACGRRDPVDKVRDPDAQGGEGTLLGRGQDGVGEPTGMKELPKSVSRSSEMLSQLTRKPSGVDPTEEHIQGWPNDVVHTAVGWSV
jgi:hypothetical protein